MKELFSNYLRLRKGRQKKQLINLVMFFLQGNLVQSVQTKLHQIRPPRLYGDRKRKGV